MTPTFAPLVPDPTSTPTVAPATAIATTTAPVAATATPVPTTPTVPPAAREAGGTLRFAVPKVGPNFDVQREVSPSVSTWGIGLIYNRLFRYTPDGSDELVECELCERWEMVAPDRLRITLRPDIRWQNIAPVNGRTLTAADVVFSLERQREPGAPNADLLTAIGEITVVDDRTIDLEIGRLGADVFLNLADGRTRIVAPEAVAENGDLVRGPNVGSGPWQWVSTDSSRSLYIRNEDYFEPGLPRLDGLEIQYIPEAKTRVVAFRVGLLDVTDATSAEVQRNVRDREGVTSTRVVNLGAGAEIALNTSSPPFDSLKVRQAIFQALDPWRDVATVWGGDGMVTLGIPVPDRSWLLTEDAMQTAFADPVRAAELMAASGVKPAAPVEITVGLFSDAYVQQAERLQAALGTLGIDSTIRQVSTRQFADRVWIGGDYQAFVGAQAPVDGLSDDLFSVHHSTGPWNTTGYATDELDALIEQQAEEMDPAARRQILLDIQFRILEGASRFTVASRVTNWLSWPWVEDFDPDPVRGENFWLARVAIGDRPEE